MARVDKATAAAVAGTVSLPLLPVKALALPELTTKARARPPGTFRIVLVEAAHVRDRLPEPIEGLVRLDGRVHRVLVIAADERLLSVRGQPLHQLLSVCLVVGGGGERVAAVADDARDRAVLVMEVRPHTAVAVRRLRASHGIQVREPHVVQPVLAPRADAARARRVAEAIQGMRASEDFQALAVLYGTAGQVLVCADFNTGQVKWTDRSIGACSLCYADGRLYLDLMADAGTYVWEAQ